MKFQFQYIISVILCTTLNLQGIKSSLTGESGLGASDSFKQAGRQIKYLLAREKPVKESLSNLENYYEDIKEKGMRKLNPRWKLRRPCKTLPDPAPELVNLELVAKKFRYHPLTKDEQFYGKFAAPKRQDLAQIPPAQRDFQNPNPFIRYPDDVGMNFVPVPVPMIQRETVYNPNPFHGYTGNYDPSGEYFRKQPNQVNQLNQVQAQAQAQNMIPTATPVQPQLSIITATPTADQNAQYIAALRSALESQSASFAAASMSNEMEQMRAGWLSQSIALMSQVNAMSQSIAYMQPTATRRY